MSAQTELQTWLNGTVDGGPESDGRYPLTSKDGVVFLVYCPAAQALNPALAELPIEIFANTASNAAATATVEAAEAEQSSIDAQTHAANALAYRNTAQTHAGSASNSAINAALSETAALDHLGSAETAADNASYSAGEAAASATAAAGSATAADASADAAAASAASITPSSYLLKTTADAAGIAVPVALTDFNANATFTQIRANQGATGAPAAPATGAWSGLMMQGANGNNGSTILFNDNWNRMFFHTRAGGVNAAWNEVWHSANFTPSDKLDASEVTTSGTANTVAKRDSVGDIHTSRLFRTSYADQTTISGAMAYRVNNGADNYIRFCSDIPAIRTWLGVPATAHTHVVADITDLPAIAETATASTLVKRTASGYIYTVHLNISGPVYASRPTNVIMEIGDGFIRRQALATFKNNIGIWVQATDPGASAIDGDLWIW